MFALQKLAAVVTLVVSVAAKDTIWLTETVYTCPCASSTLFAANTTTTSLQHTSSQSLTSTISSLSITSTSTIDSSTTTKSTTSSSATASSTDTCIPLNGDCTNETEDFYCCTGYVCDVGLDTPTCIVDDTLSSSSSSASTVVATTPTSTTTTSSATATSTDTCIPLNGDCTNETEDFYCCTGYVCDVGLDTPTCIVDDTLASSSTTSSTVTTTPASTTTTSTTSAASTETCIPLNGDCTNSTEDFYCCTGYICDSGLDTPTCIVDDS